jgi:hypothetical protein
MMKINFPKTCFLALTAQLSFFATGAILSLQAQTDLLDEAGYIHQWLMLAPVSLEEEESGSEAIVFPIIRREKDLQPQAGDSVTIAGQTHQWVAKRTDEVVFDFNKVLGGNHDHAAGYLAVYVHAPKAMENITLLAGGNDQARIYLNGEAVSTSFEARALTRDSDVARGLTLRKGFNTLILKVINEVGNWQGCLRVLDADGKPPEGVSLKLANR